MHVTCQTISRVRTCPWILPMLTVQAASAVNAFQFMLLRSRISFKVLSLFSKLEL